MVRTILILLVAVVLSCCNDKHPNQKINSKEFYPFIVQETEKGETNLVNVKGKKKKVTITKAPNGNITIKTKGKKSILSRKTLILSPIKSDKDLAFFTKQLQVQKELKNQDLISFKCGFIELENNETKDLFFFQEGISKYFIERSKNREGILFTLGEQLKIKFKPKGVKNAEVALNELANEWNRNKAINSCFIDEGKWNKVQTVLQDKKIEHFNSLFYLNPVSNLVELIIQPSMKTNEKNNLIKVEQTENCRKRSDSLAYYFNIKNNTLCFKEDSLVITTPLIIPKATS